MKIILLIVGALLALALCLILIYRALFFAGNTGGAWSAFIGCIFAVITLVSTFRFLSKSAERDENGKPISIKGPAIYLALGFCGTLFSIYMAGLSPIGFIDYLFT